MTKRRSVRSFVSHTPSLRLLFGSVLLFAAGARAENGQKQFLACDAQAKALVAKMTLAEKAGQMCQPDLGSIKDFSDIETLFLGSILSGGSSDPKAGNSMQAWRDLYEDCQKHALKTRLAIPLLYGVDAVHGHNNVLSAVIIPHNVGLGCTRDPAIVEAVARVTAAEVRATGIQWPFAPCVAVPRDIRWGRTYEGFSEDQTLTARLGAAAVQGLQGGDLAAGQSVLACAKHFVGDGGTTFGSAKGEGLLDQGDTQIDEPTLRAIHLPGYPAALAAGVGTIMPSYSSWNGVKCHGSKALLTDLLKKELGFEGFLISDYNAIDQIIPPAKKEGAGESNNASGQEGTADYKKCIEISINAGLDMIMVTDKYRDFIAQLQEVVNEGRIPMSRVDDAVTRILRVKFAMGMMAPDAKLMADPALAAKFGSAEHRAVARQAVRQSLVLLKNDKQTLPLSRKAKRIHVTGRGADDVGMQCGGWTIDWQGNLGAVTPGGTSILQALRAAAGSTVRVTSTNDAPDSAGADMTVVVIGEEPYAEMKGDRKDLGVCKADAEAVAAAKASGVPVVVVVLSGRPIVLGAIADQADAIVAAWLPGTEGAGIADVLFGDVKPTGRLAFAWPRDMSQIPRGTGAPAANPLYPLNFGLSY